VLMLQQSRSLRPVLMLQQSRSLRPVLEKPLRLTRPPWLRPSPSLAPWRRPGRRRRHLPPNRPGVQRRAT